jgi:hypothetical protein
VGVGVEVGFGVSVSGIRVGVGVDVAVGVSVEGTGVSDGAGVAVCVGGSDVGDSVGADVAVGVLVAGGRAVAVTVGGSSVGELVGVAARGAVADRAGAQSVPSGHRQRQVAGSRMNPAGHVSQLAHPASQVPAPPAKSIASSRRRETGDPQILARLSTQRPFMGFLARGELEANHRDSPARSTN